MTSSTKTVKLIGSESQLENLKELTIEVDVSGITKRTTKTVALNAKDNDVKSISPEQVKVTVKPSSAD
ncbi:CdaR family protein [Secundilactobacillus oryzae]|uniref:CdaR family protein n=1 Tax=Secundilactobacillus oryzae TaxID=1202668 RepID=UPI000A6060F8|nr:CdaR family protein [Secundilactobacillus oryzae]